tara:strand:- start:88 stop:432 length:345 start_codon:yes stop_codon:yes gene_type:complete
MTIETLRSITTASQYHACFESAREKYVKRFIQCIESQKEVQQQTTNNNNNNKMSNNNKQQQNSHPRYKKPNRDTVDSSVCSLCFLRYMTNTDTRGMPAAYNTKNGIPIIIAHIK